jgi:hypothetical protein
MSTPFYTPTDEDKQSAAAVLELLGIPGAYRSLDDGTEKAIKVKPHSNALELGEDGRRSGFEAAMTFYIAVEDVPSPVSGDLVCFDGGPWMAVEGFEPNGGLWALSVYPNMSPVP